MSKQKVIICHSINENLADAISQCTYDKLFILVDEHTRKLCIPLIQEAGFMKDAQLIASAQKMSIRTSTPWPMCGNN